MLELRHRQGKSLVEVTQPVMVESLVSVSLLCSRERLSWWNLCDPWVTGQSSIRTLLLGEPRQPACSPIRLGAVCLISSAGSQHYRPHHSAFWGGTFLTCWHYKNPIPDCPTHSAAHINCWTWRSLCFPCDESLLEGCGAYEEMQLLQGLCTPVNTFMANLLCQGLGEVLWEMLR